MKSNRNDNKLDIKQLTGSISAWLETEVGKQKIHDSTAKTRKAVDTLNKARVVDSEPVPVFGQDFEQLQVFLRNEDGAISPGRFASVFSFDLKTLASAAHVSMERLRKTPNDENVQRYLRESLQITGAATGIAQTVERALFWFKNAPLQPFDYKTGHELASEGRTSDVLRYISSLEAGFSG